MSFFADSSSEGWRSITSPYLATLQAKGGVVGIVTGSAKSGSSPAITMEERTRSSGDRAS
jgi:hypothetical protein